MMIILLCSCATPPDVPVCVELDPWSGFCTNTLSDKEFIVDDTHPLEVTVDGKIVKKTWWEMRPFMIQMPPSSYVAFKTFVIKTCKQNQKRKECAEDLYSWQRKMRSIEQKVEEKGQSPSP